MSGSPAGPIMAWLLEKPTRALTDLASGLVMQALHLWISAWPSAMAKPQAPLCKVDGVSFISVACGLKKPASLMLSGCSSRKTQVSVGPGCRNCEDLV